MSNLRCVLFGGNGLLGQALKPALNRLTPDLHCPTREVVDLQDFDDLVKYVVWATHAQERAVVINSAALSDIDGCERMPERCFHINAVAPVLMALACQRTGAEFIQISTDQVFHHPPGNDIRHHEDDNPAGYDQPVNLYGQAKLAAEQYVRQYPKATIVRVQWLYGPGRKTFVDHVAQSLINGVPFQVVSDYYGTPTYTPDVAEAIGQLIQRPSAYRVFHLVDGKESLNRVEWAMVIADHLGLMPRFPELAQRVERSQISGWVAQRPRASLLGVHREPRLRPWRVALAEYLAKYRQPLETAQ